MFKFVEVLKWVNIHIFMSEKAPQHDNKWEVNPKFHSFQVLK